MNITGPLLVSVLQQPVNQTDDMAIVGFKLAMAPELHQLLEILHRV